VYVLVLSLGDPVSRTFLDLLPDTPLVETRGNVEVRRFRDVPLVIFRGDPTQFDREDVLTALGRYAIFISRHEMSNPKPLFTVHTPGSWPDVSVAHPPLTTSIFRALCKAAYEPYSCAFEATHHTPNTSVVSATFVEVGSTENEWRDKKAADTLLQVLEEVLNKPPEGKPAAMVIGDLHYITVGNMALSGEVDIGHVVPKYIDIKLDIVQTAFKKHTVPIEKVIIFRKNVKNPARTEIVDFLRRLGVEVLLKG
jgi:Uncharacterized protein conserved in archaea